MPNSSFGRRKGAGLLCAALCLASALPLAACSGRPAPDAQALLVSPARDMAEEGGRVSPVYEQWLYKQSMLFQAREAQAKVSGSRLVWRHTAAWQDRALLRQAAPTWLVADVPALPRPGLAALAASAGELAAGGINGVLLLDACESDAAWVPDQAPAAFRQASLNLPRSAGGEEGLEELAKALQAAGLQSGMETAPAATGLGPDFMLQARGSERHRGLYAMAEVPAACWSLLPAASRPWDCLELSAEAAAALAEARVLPGPLRQDMSPQGRVRTGWAATGPVLGVDGQTRRLVYRFFSSPWQPVLCWQDPGQAARGLLAGSVISVTGLRRQALAAIRPDALAGLDAAAGPAAGSARSKAAALTPAPLALADLGQQVRRCGGWSLALGAHALALMGADPEAADFFEAGDLAALAARALASGDAAPLAAWLRGLQASGLPLASMAFASPAGLPELPPAPAGGTRPDAGAADSLADARARLAHLALALPCGLPGLALLDAGLYAGHASGIVPKSGRDRGAAAALAPALQARARLDLAGGRLVRVEQPAKGLLVVVSAPARGGLFITAANFSDRPASPGAAIAAAAGGAPVTCLTPQASSGTTVPSPQALSLRPRQAAHFLVGADLRR